MSADTWLKIALIAAVAGAMLQAKVFGAVREALVAVKEKIPVKRTLAMAGAGLVYIAAMIGYGFASDDWLVVAVLVVPTIASKLIYWAINTDAKENARRRAP